MIALFDSNILIDMASGHPSAGALLDDYSTHIISVVNYSEALVGATNKDQQQAWEEFLHSFLILDVTLDVATCAADLRRKKRIKLPDACIYATALLHNATLITRNTKDFSAKDPNIHIPYTL